MENVLIASSILLWIVVLFNLLLTLALVRRSGNTQRRPKVEPLAVGRPAPDFTAETPDGRAVTLADFDGRALALVFASPTCAPCTERLPELEALAPTARQSGVDLVLVYKTEATETNAYLDEHGVTIPTLISSPSSSFWQDYKVPGTPFYCLVNEKREVAATGFFDDTWEGLVAQWRESAEAEKALL